MTKLSASPFKGRPLLDIASYARRGPARRDRLSAAEIALISRTVTRVPEAVVKVLPKDSNNHSSVSRHIGYIGRYGDLELETDDGGQLAGRVIGSQLLEDWDLDLDKHRRRSDLAAALGRTPPKLVHKLMFSMPPGTPARGVLAAARDFLREEFALKHRYAFVLHTDEPHPHVHAVVKAVSEQGTRLHIKKATLREWRSEFARHLREHGIQANATERAVRGESRGHKSAGIYRAAQRSASSHMLLRVQAVTGQLRDGRRRTEAGKTTLLETRTNVQRGWSAVSEMLTTNGHPELAGIVNRFAAEMSPPRTEKEWLAHDLVNTPHGSRMRDLRQNR